MWLNINTYLKNIYADCIKLISIGICDILFEEMIDAISKKAYVN